MIKSIIYILLLCFLGIAACSEDKELEILEDLKVDYKLPQGGNSKADERILQMHEKWGCYILYDYTSWDFYYDISKNYYYTLPNPEIIDEALDWLDENIFKKYPDKFLRDYLPYRILLTDSLYTLTYQAWDDRYRLNMERYALSNQTLALGYCNENIATVSSYKFYVHFYLWEYWIRSYKNITPPSEFSSVSNYATKPSDDPNSSDYYLKRGFIPNASQGINKLWSWDGDLEMADFYSYICLMVFYRNSYPTQYADWLTYPLVKQKHDIIIKYFQENYGIDIRYVYLAN